MQCTRYAIKKNENGGFDHRSFCSFDHENVVFFYFKIENLNRNGRHAMPSYFSFILSEGKNKQGLADRLHAVRHFL